MRTLRVLPFALFSLLVFAPAFAQNTLSDSLPEALKDWVPWVQDPAQDCVRSSQGFECNYIPSLNLVLDDEGGTFSLTSTLYKDGYLTLPGGPHAGRYR